MADLVLFQHRATSALVRLSRFNQVLSPEQATHLWHGMTELQTTHQGLPTQCLVLILRLSLNGQQPVTQSLSMEMVQMVAVLQQLAIM